MQSGKRNRVLQFGKMSISATSSQCPQTPVKTKEAFFITTHLKRQIHRVEYAPFFICSMVGSLCVCVLFHFVSRFIKAKLIDTG